MLFAAACGLLDERYMLQEAVVHRLLALRTAAVLALAISPAAAQADSTAAVVVADDGGLDMPAVRAIRTVTAGELRKRGVAVSEDARQEAVQPVDARLAAMLQEIGVSRLFVLRIGGRLGQKVPLSLEEVSAQRFALVAAASLTATTLDEADIVAARLVSAVLDRTSADGDAGMRTVTATEARPFQKKPGERFWVVGLPLLLVHGDGGYNTPAGFSLSYFYEAESFRVGASALAATRDGSGIGWFGLDAAWLPLDTEISPFVGVGLGYMGAAQTGGLAGRVSAGIELFRLHGVRLLGSVDAAIPFFSTPGSALASSPQVRSWYPMAHVQIGF
jgi:hypothetical protein